MATVPKAVGTISSPAAWSFPSAGLTVRGFLRWRGLVFAFFLLSMASRRSTFGQFALELLSGCPSSSIASRSAWIPSRTLLMSALVISMPLLLL
jgi:hypothetical protein